MSVIPTSSRLPLPRGWSYAIGAERLSSILKDVPQFAALSLSFLPSEAVLLSDQVRAIASGKPIAICRVSYQNLQPGLTGSHDHIERGWYEETWKVAVHAVPSSFRRAAEEAIVASAARLTSWLTTPRPETWRYGRHACAVRMRLKDGQVTFQQE